MTIAQYFAKTKGTWPKVGVAGVESEWMDAGTLEVPNGQLWAGDPWVVDKRNGCAVRLPRGTYRVQVKGMHFKGHRRTARVRALLKGTAKPARGTACGRMGTDCGWISLFDLAAYKKAVTAKRAAAYESDLTDITKMDGM